MFLRFSRDLEMVTFIVIALLAHYDELIHVCFVFHYALCMKRFFSSYCPIKLFGNTIVLSSFGDVETESQEEKVTFAWS